jgi:hypothetical protein
MFLITKWKKIKSKQKKRKILFSFHYKRMSSNANFAKLSVTDLKLGSQASDLTISNSSNTMNIKAANNAGGVNIMAGTNGINLDATLGNGTTTDTYTGAVTIKSKNNSSWLTKDANLEFVVHNGSLTLETVDGATGPTNMLIKSAQNMEIESANSMEIESLNSMSLNSATDMKMDSNTNIYIGYTGATNIEIGHANVVTKVKNKLLAPILDTETSSVLYIGNTNATGIDIGKASTITKIKGNMVINGSLSCENVITTNSTVVNTGTKYLNLSGGNKDSGIIINKSGTFIGTGRGVPVGSPSYTLPDEQKTFYLDGTDNLTNANSVIEITEENSLFSGQTNTVSTLNSGDKTVLFVGNWSPVVFPGNNIYTFSSGVLTATPTVTGTPVRFEEFQNELTGSVIKLNDNNFCFVRSVTDDNKLSVSLTSLIGVGALSLTVIQPGTVSYISYQAGVSAMYWDHEESKFIFANLVKNPANNNISVADTGNLLADLHANSIFLPTGGTGGNINASSANFNIGLAAGNTQINGTLGVTGPVLFSGSLGVTGPVLFGGSLGVTGPVNFYSDLTVAGITNFASVNIASTDISGNLTADSASVANLLEAGSIEVTGTAQFNTLTVDGETTINDDFNVVGETILTGGLNVTSAVDFDTTLTVAGVTTLNGSLNATGPADFGNTLTVAGATILSGSLGVTGPASFGNTLTVNDDTLAVLNDVWTGSTYELGVFTGASLMVNGGVGIKKNLIVQGLEGGGVGEFIQNNTSATEQSNSDATHPVIQFVQADINQPFIQFVGKSVSSGVIPKTFIKAHVNTTMNVQGYILVGIQDKSGNFDSVNTKYYLPICTLESTDAEGQ